jgi:hypothetical protein
MAGNGRATRAHRTPRKGERRRESIVGRRRVLRAMAECLVGGEVGERGDRAVIELSEVLSSLPTIHWDEGMKSSRKVAEVDRMDRKLTQTSTIPAARTTSVARTSPLKARRNSLPVTPVQTPSSNVARRARTPCLHTWILRLLASSSSVRVGGFGGTWVLSGTRSEIKDLVTRRRGAKTGRETSAGVTRIARGRTVRRVRRSESDMGSSD